MMNKKRGKALIFNGKKGITHDLFFNVFELLLAFIVAFALFNFVNDIIKQTIFEKNYLTRDLALIINTLYAAPGEVVYNYDEDVGEFIIDFTGDIDNTDNKYNRVSVYLEEESIRNIFYLFAEDKNLPFQYKILSSGEEDFKIGFFKSDQYVDVDLSGSIGQDEN